MGRITIKRKNLYTENRLDRADTIFWSFVEIFLEILLNLIDSLYQKR